MIFKGQVEYVNSFFGYPIYKKHYEDSTTYFVGGYGQEHATLDLALEHTQYLMEKNL